MLPDQLVVGADTSAGDNHGLRIIFIVANDLAGAFFAPAGRTRCKYRAPYPDDRILARNQLIDLVTRTIINYTEADGVSDPGFKWLYDPGSGPPHNMKTRNGIAVALGEISAAFRPANDREEPNT
ncbi:Uncharacterised protein [Actinobacillus pleuropneumoniae]|nr:Uncharacterised protein [Actinobacillus pleuropneumoniae]